MLQDISSFEKSRAELRDLRNAVGWSKIGKYFQMARTLDETYYPSLTRKVLNIRNMRQVVTRECKETINGADISDAARPILMVSQFWIWRLNNLVLSSYSPPGKLHSRPKDYEADDSVPYGPKRDIWIEKKYRNSPQTRRAGVSRSPHCCFANRSDQALRSGTSDRSVPIST